MLRSIFSFVVVCAVAASAMGQGGSVRAPRSTGPGDRPPESAPATQPAQPVPPAAHSAEANLPFVYELEFVKEPAFGYYDGYRASMPWPGADYPSEWDPEIRTWAESGQQPHLQEWWSFDPQSLTYVVTLNAVSTINNQALYREVARKQVWHEEDRRAGTALTTRFALFVEEPSAGHFNGKVFRRDLEGNLVGDDYDGPYIEERWQWKGKREREGWYEVSKTEITFSEGGFKQRRRLDAVRIASAQPQAPTAERARATQRWWNRQ